MYLTLTSLNGKNGFAIDGINLDDRAGYSAASAGDINGDGKDDLIIGAPNAGSENRGQVYVMMVKLVLPHLYCYLV
ncbi:MAG: integrin alpha [Candidatus Midichloria sp.]